MSVFTTNTRVSRALQVVPDVAPGFNVPTFYEDFVVERRAHVHRKVERNYRRAAAAAAQQEQQQQMQPLPDVSEPDSSAGIP